MGNYAIWNKFFIQYFRKPQPYLASRIDRAPHEVLNLSDFSAATALSKSSLYSMSFEPVINKLWNWDLNWAIGQRAFWRVLTKNQRYCPLCLLDKSYYKLVWQIHELNICIKHHVILEKQCPSCLKPIPHLLDKSKIGICVYCNSDLSTAKPRYLDVDNVYHRIYNDWIYLLDTSASPLINKDSLINMSKMLLNKLAYLVSQYSPKYGNKKKRYPFTFRLIMEKEKKELTFPYLNTILAILRTYDLSLKELSELQVPECFEMSNSSTKRAIEI